MKALFLFTGLMLALMIMAGGCTSQPQPVPQATTVPASPVMTPVPTSPAVLPPTLTGQGWSLGWYDDTKGVWSSVIQGSNISAWFGTDGNVSGGAGCTKYYSTPYQTAKPGEILIRRPIGEMTDCRSPTGVVSQDSAYFTDLEWSTTYTITGNQLLMFDKTGKKILQFDRMTP